MRERRQQQRRHSGLGGVAAARARAVEDLVEDYVVPVHQRHPAARRAQVGPELLRVDRPLRPRERARRQHHDQLRQAEDAWVQPQHVGDQRRPAAARRDDEVGRLGAHRNRRRLARWHHGRGVDPVPRNRGSQPPGLPGTVIGGALAKGSFGSDQRFLGTVQLEQALGGQHRHHVVDEHGVALELAVRLRQAGLGDVQQLEHVAGRIAGAGLGVGQHHVWLRQARPGGYGFQGGVADAFAVPRRQQRGGDGGPARPAGLGREVCVLAEEL